MNFYKHHLGDYAAATVHLSWDEDCAYRRLIDQYYKRETPIPADLKEACRLVRATTPAQKRAVETVLKEFFRLESDGWHQKRCDEEIDAANAQASTNRRIAEEREARRRTRTEHESFNGSYNEPITNRSPAHMGGRADFVNLSRLQTPDSTSQTPDSKTKTPESPPGISSGFDTLAADSQTLAAPAEGGEEPAPKRKATKRMPGSYDAEPMRQWARENTPGVDFTTEIAKLRDHQFRTAHSDWDAVVRNWLRRALEQQPPPRLNGNNGSHHPVTKFERYFGSKPAPEVDEHGNKINF